MKKAPSIGQRFYKQVPERFPDRGYYKSVIGLYFGTRLFMIAQASR